MRTFNKAAAYVTSKISGMIHYKNFIQSQHETYLLLKEAKACFQKQKLANKLEISW